MAAKTAEMTIHSKSELWRTEPEMQKEGNSFFEDLEFVHTSVFLKKGDEFYYAITDKKEEQFLSPVKLECIRIPDEHVYPDADPTFIMAPDPLPSNVHVKTLDLIGYEAETAGPEWATIILEEARTLEFLHKHPHPNIAQYLGCVVTEGKLRGICLAKHNNITLAQHMRKGEHVDVERVMAGLERAVSHLHGLNLVHNDIHPLNVMLDNGNNNDEEVEEAVLVDFASCRPEGAKLGLAEGTRFLRAGGPGPETARFENDLDALAKIREHLEKHNASLTATTEKKN